MIMIISNETDIVNVEIWSWGQGEHYSQKQGCARSVKESVRDIL